MKVIWRITLYALLPTLCIAQTPDTLWTQLYGGNNTDVIHDVIETQYHGFLFTGYTHSSGAGGADVWIAMTDSAGSLLWEKAYGGNGQDIGNQIIVTADNGYIVIGRTDSYGSGETDIWVIRTDSLGDSLWTRSYGTSGWDFGESLVETSDQGYVLAGSMTNGSRNLWLSKIDADGNILWEKTYGGDGSDAGYSICNTNDNGFIVTGINSSINNGIGDIWLLKTDSLGDTLWTEIYGDTLGGDCGYEVVQTSDLGYLICGYTGLTGMGDQTGVVIKTDSQGTLLWQKYITSGFINAARSCTQIHDNDYIITGYYHDDMMMYGNIWTMKLDSLGDTIWTYIYDRNDMNLSYSAIQTADSGYVVGGTTEEPYSYDGLLIKFESETGIHETSDHDISFRSFHQTIVNGPLQLSPNYSQKIFDITGRQIHTLNPAPGVYFIKVDGEIRQKVIKIR